MLITKNIMRERCSLARCTDLTVGAHLRLARQNGNDDLLKTTKKERREIDLMLQQGMVEKDILESKCTPWVMEEL